MFRFDSLLSLLLHDIRGGVVDVSLTLFQHLFGHPLDGGKVVTGVGKLIRLDLQHGHILQNHLKNKTAASRSNFLKCINKYKERWSGTHLLKVLLLLLRICVIKAHDQLALKSDLVVLVEKSCLGMTDVQVPSIHELKHETVVFHPTNFVV